MTFFCAWMIIIHGAIAQRFVGKPLAPQTPPTPKPIALRVELEEIKPLVWRRIVVPNQLTLASLHPSNLKTSRLASSACVVCAF